MSAPAPNRSRPARRGAVLPFMCVTLTTLVGAAALAIDLGRLYATGAEAQAAADATALAGARFLQQYSPFYYAITYNAYGMGAVTSAMRIAGAPARLTNYGPINYNPSTGAVTTSPSWDAATGVQVTVSGTPRYVLAGALGLTPPTVSRTATAWVASVNGATCVRPLALPYTRDFEAGAHRNAQDSTWTKQGVAPEYSYSAVASLQPIFPYYNSPQGRTYTSIPQWEKENVVMPPNQNTGRVVTGRWIPVDFGGGVGDVYSAFTSYVAAQPKAASCQAASAQVGTDEVPLPNYSNPSDADKQSLLDAATLGFKALCRRANSGNDAHCYDADGSVGVRVRVMLADSLPGTSSGGAFRVNTREVTMVRVMCYFTGPGDVCNPAMIKDETSPNAPSTYWQILGSTFSGYPAGTISVLLDGPTSLDLTSDVVLGNKPGITQRLMLVK